LIGGIFILFIIKNNYICIYKDINKQSIEYKIMFGVNNNNI